MSERRLRLAVLISGGGRTLLNLHKHINTGKLHATIEVVVSSRADVQGVERSRELGLPTLVVERRGPSAEAFHRQITDAVTGVDLVCMGGFLALWRFPEEMYGRVINIHPALLPNFGGRGMYGVRVHKAVLAAGETVSGCTVHFCDNQYDHGPIILQRRVPVLPDDTPETLAARVIKQECIAYPEVIRLLGEDRVRLQGREVTIVQSAVREPPA